MNHSDSLDTAAGSVHRDWIGWLPEGKQRAFDVHERELETRYWMLSLTLDEAISLHNRGSQRKAVQNIAIVPALCGRLTHYLRGLLCSLELHVKDNGLVPNVASLDPAHFLRQRDKYLARKNALLGRVLLTRQSAFLFKINMLQEMVCRLGDDLCDSAKALLSAGARTAYSGRWADMDTGHFDLNTCLRELLVMLRCFLRVLPDNQVSGFEETVAIQMAAPEPPRAAAHIGSPVLENTGRA